MSVLGKIGIVLAVIVFFFVGLLGTVYLSLRTPEVKVPDIMGKDRYAAETMLENAGLKMHIRSTKPSVDQKPDTILNQVPEAGQVVKAGIEVAVQVSRAPKEGENVASSAEEKPQEANQNSQNANANQTATTNQNQNQNKPKNKNKNSNNSNNRNANNSNNANNSSANRNANSTNRNASAGNSNRSANTAPPSTNRTSTNVNKRPPATTPGANKGTP